MKNLKPNNNKNHKSKAKPDIRKPTQKFTPKQPQAKSQRKANPKNLLKESSSDSGSPNLAESQAQKNSDFKGHSPNSSSQSPEQGFISFNPQEEDNSLLNSNSSKPQPWFNLSDYSPSLSPSERLHKEVEAAIKYLSPTAKEIELRQFLFNLVEKSARYLWPNSKAHIFGSFSTKLFLPTSDVDVVIVIPNFNERRIADGLEQLLKEISKSLSFKTYEIRRTARVPLINFVERISGLEVDVSINAVSGIEGRAIVSSFIHQCPAIKPINMIMKQFLELSELNKVFTGGLSSYALTLIIISFFQIHPLIRAGKINPLNNLGLVLIEFFELYGVCFNNDQIGITLTNGGRYYRRSQESLHRRAPSVVTIEVLDPQNETNNVSSGSHNYHDVKFAFRGAYISLTNMVAKYCQREENSSFEQPLLGSIIHIPESTIQQRQQILSAYDAFIKKR